MSCQNHLRKPRRLLRASVDVSARFTAVSPAWRTVLGWDVGALLGESFVARVHPDDMDAAVAAIHSALSGGAAVCFQARYAHHTGTYLTLGWCVDPQLDSLQIDVQGRLLP